MFLKHEYAKGPFSLEGSSLRYLYHFISLLFRKPSLPTLSKTIHETHAPLLLLYLSAKPYHDLWNSFSNIWKSSLITARRGWLLTDDRLKSRFLNMDCSQHGLSRAFLALSLASYFLCHPVRSVLLPPITLPHLNHTCSSCVHLPVQWLGRGGRQNCLRSAPPLITHVILDTFLNYLILRFLSLPKQYNYLTRLFWNEVTYIKCLAQN